MIFKLQFSMNNAAFDESEVSEAVRILREVADKIEKTATVPNMSESIRDVNGNRVGQYSAKVE